LDKSDERDCTIIRLDDYLKTDSPIKDRNENGTSVNVSIVITTIGNFVEMDMTFRCQFPKHFTRNFCFAQLFSYYRPYGFVIFWQKNTGKKAAREILMTRLFFALLGPVQVKSAPKMLVILTPGVNCINILRAAFAPKLFDQKNYKVKL
jgi:hypothetical protein